MPTITQMEKVVVIFESDIPYMIPEVLREKFIQVRSREEFDKLFGDYKYKRGEFDLYVEAKGIYSKYNTDTALK